MELKMFDPVIYPYLVWVVIANEPSIIAEKFNEYSGQSIIFEVGDVDRHQAFTMPVQSKDEHKRFGVVLFFRSKQSMTFELVSHESSHAAKYLFEHIGASVKEHEPFEYAVGWIAKCCEAVKKSK